MDGALNLGVYEGSSLKHWNLQTNGVAGRIDAVSGKRYYLKDHLGSTRSVVDASGLVTQSSDFYPFGLQMPGRDYLADTRSKELFTGKERDSETGWDYFGARYYDAAIGRFLGVDPLADAYAAWTPYHYALNNPSNNFDLDGRSTVTDSAGNVIHVDTQDDDLSVYQATTEQGGTNEFGISGGPMSVKTKKGETEHIDEFVSPETGETLTNYRIQFGKSFDPIISSMNELAQGMDLQEIAAESSPGGKFDIKKPYKNVGALLNGKYATSRSAGNYLAGYNAQGGTYFGQNISFDTFQKIAGALHVKGSLTNTQKAGIVLFGNSYGPSPAYGENMYQYRMSRAGWMKAKLNR